MPIWTDLQNSQAEQLIQLAIAEDLGTAGDITSIATLSGHFVGQAAMVARKPGCCAGMPILQLMIHKHFSRLQLHFQVQEGQTFESGSTLAVIHGPIRDLLSFERSALNFLQRLCGIATLTHEFVQAIQGTKAQILDTRKTTPGWRHLEKYAVTCGGGINHRLGLYDAFLIKDNHLAGIHAYESAQRESLAAVTQMQLPTAIELAIRTCRNYKPGLPIEIEVDRLEQFDEALQYQPDIILIDNFSLSDSREAVRRRDALAPTILLEASGGVRLNTVRAIAETGVDRISVGALTHSAIALDIGLDYLPE